MKLSLASGFAIALIFSIAPALAHADISTGLVGHWKLDEGSGSTAADSSGNSNSGTLNSPAWTTGHIGAGALDFDGSNDYVYVADSPSLNLTTFSVGGWVNLSANTSNWKPLFTKENNSGGQRNYGIYIESLPSNPHYHFSFQDSSCSSYVSYNSNGTAPLNTWQHVIMTYDGSSFKFYINGVEDSSYSVSLTPCQSATQFRIAEPPTVYDAFPGKMDDVRVYNRALSAADVSELYAYTESAPSTGSSYNMTGYAWSSTVGWISFNCSNTSSCGDVNYGVNLDASGELVGYAWSSNVGWIKFGGLSSFPSGSGTTASNAQVVGGNLIGWAKALSADGNGWDGWISLSGNTGAGGTYGVVQNVDTFNGQAWGSDVVGWVSFDIAGANGVKLSGGAYIDIKVGGTSIISTTNVPYNSIPTFEWEITNLPGASCSITKISAQGTSFSALTGLTASGSYVADPLTDAVYSYRLQCTQGAVTVVSTTVSFEVLAEDPAFTLGSDETMRFLFNDLGTSISEPTAIFVNGNQPFIALGNPVTVTLTGGPTGIASTTITYSFDNGATYSASPTRVINNYAQGFNFKVKIVRLTDAPPLDDGSGIPLITLRGQAAGSPDAYKNIQLEAQVFVPVYEEY